MTIWVARAGRYGERENFALEKGLALIGWEELGDLSSCETKDEISNKLIQYDPNAKAGTISNHASQIWNFIHKMKKGDIFAIPLKTRPAIAIGTIIGDYKFIKEHPTDAQHTRAVEWIGEPIPRNRFEQDLLYSFGSALTVFTVKRNNAEERIKAILDGRTYTLPHGNSEEDESLNDLTLDISRYSSDQIVDFIGRRFSGHKMETLISAILRAKGFTVLENEKKGSDGGADILAGKGEMGFDSPRLCVQVKSSDRAIDSKDYDELKGVMQKFGADFGLFVSWGGFKSTVINESRRDFYKIRLWSGDDIVKELQSVYNKLPETVQAEVPLQQIWSIIPDSD